MKNELEVRHLGQPLSQPYIVTIMVVSKGRKDISSASFDGGQPIVANLGVPIIQELRFDAATKSRGVPVPKVVIDGTRVLVGPSMLAKRHTLTFTALVEGEPSLSSDIPILDIRRVDKPPIAIRLEAPKAFVLAGTAIVILYVITQPTAAAAAVEAALAAAKVAAEAIITFLRSLFD